MSDDNTPQEEFDRTELAEDRTVMAVERTFAGWLRTAFAGIGIGIAFRALFNELEPPWLARTIATLFVVLSALLVIGAERRAAHALKRVKAHAVEPLDAPHIRWTAYAVAAGALVLAVAFWLMEDVTLPLVGSG